MLLWCELLAAWLSTMLFWEEVLPLIQRAHLFFVACLSCMVSSADANLLWASHVAGGSAGDVGRVTNRAAGGCSTGGAGFSAAGGGSAGGAGFFAGGGGLLVALIKLGGASAGGAGGVGFVVGIFLGTIVLLLCSFNNLTQMGSFTNEGAGGTTAGTCSFTIAAGSLANCATQW